MRVFLFLILLLLFGSQPTRANQVWWEYGIASATVGYDKLTKQWVQDRYVLAVISTPDLVKRMSIVHPQCSPSGSKKSQLLVEIRRDIQGRFAEFPTLSALTKEAPDITEEVVKQAQLKRLSAFETLLFEALEKTRAAYLTCGLQQQELDGLSLALIRRHCGRSGSPTCKNNVPKFGGTSSETGFSVVVDWLDARVSAANDVAAAKVVLSHNRPVFLAFSGANAVTLANSVAAPFVEANTWPVLPSSSTLFALSANAIQQVRAEKNALLSGTLPRLLMLPDRAAVAMLDAVANPREAYDRAERRANDMKQTVLVGVADEIARTRITECRRFLAKLDLQELSKCSGYQLDQVSLINCMSQKECMPMFDTTSIRRDVALYAEVLNSKQLATSSMIGRVSATYSQLVAESNKCRELGGSAKDIAKCLNVNTLPPKAAAFESCVQQAKTNSSRLECVSQASGVQLPSALAKCVASNKDQAACLMNAALPQLGQDIANVQECLRFGLSTSQMKTCLSKLPLGGDAALVAECLPSNDKTDVARVALCLGGDRLPNGVRQAVACFANGGGELASTAACLTKEALPGIPPDVSKLLVCAAESQGDPMGTAICTASDSLNAELRIAMQCAVSSGGEPSATAVCSFGRLTLKELQQCSGKKFGDEGCFGKGNEIQKLAKVLLGQEIGPNSLVGQVITFNLTTIKDAVAFSEAAFKEGGKLLQNIGNEASVAGKAVESVVANIIREQEKLIQNAGKAAEQAAQDAANAVQQAANEAARLLQQVLPKIDCCRIKW